MKEEKKDLYRIDPLKIQRKIYNMYSVNSNARKMMVKEDKLKELGKLSSSLAGFPLQDTGHALKDLLEENKKVALKGLLFGFLGAGSIFLFTYATTVIESVFVFVLMSVLFLNALKYFKTAFIQTYLLKTFGTYLDKTSSRILELKKDIFDDFSGKNPKS